MKKRFDMAGKRFGKLFVQEFSHVASSGDAMWRCLCDCGNTTAASSATLRKGTKRSCGCLVLTHAANMNRTHGHTVGRRPSRTLTAWKNMMARCYDSENVGHKNYGARGITVCKRWHKFENFLADMGVAPEGMTLDRTNNARGYSPSNCAWRTRKEQAENKRTSVNITYKGVTRSQKDWGLLLGGTATLVRDRLRLGWSVEKALTTPLRATRTKDEP